MSTASFPSNRDYPLQIAGKHLQIGELSISIYSARVCWIPSDQTSVQVYCQSKKGECYQAGITLMLQTTEKVKKCIALLIANTQVRFSLPYLETLQPDERSVGFSFSSSEAASEFGTYYAPCFFPSEEFDISLKNKGCVILGKKDENSVARINKILNQLDDRLFDHPILEKLFHNNDERFPGRIYPKRPECATAYDYSGKYEPKFIVTPNQITQIHWDKNLTKGECPSTCAELNNFINVGSYKVLIHEKETWELFCNNLKVTGDPNFNPLIERIETALKGSQTFTKEFIEAQFTPSLSALHESSPELGFMAGEHLQHAIDRMKEKDRQDSTA